MKVQLFKSQTFKGKSEEKATDKESFFEKQENCFNLSRSRSFKKWNFKKSKHKSFPKQLLLWKPLEV
jgi:hypothetical protein